MARSDRAGGDHPEGRRRRARPLPYQIAIDKYLAKPDSRLLFSFLICDRLSNAAAVGIAQIGALYVGSCCSSAFLLEFTQTYLMQWTGQKVMFDLRSQIFRHLQRMHIAFFDRNPVGRLVTRVTTDVDALNEMFTAGVVSIFEDVFVLAGILVIMLQHELAAGADRFCRAAAHLYATTRSSATRCATATAGFASAIARINAYLQEHVTGIVRACSCSIARSASYKDFQKINASHMEAFKDAILAYAVYYPVVEMLSPSPSPA